LVRAGRVNKSMERSQGYPTLVGDVRQKLQTAMKGVGGFKVSRGGKGNTGNDLLLYSYKAVYNSMFAPKHKKHKDGWLVLRELRSLVVDGTMGRVVARPLPKFMGLFGGAVESRVHGVSGV
jgi:hypothetical protein